MGSKTKQLTLLLPVWTRCSSVTSVPVREAENNLDVLGGAAMDLWVLLGSGVFSSSVATDAMVLSGVLVHVTASPCEKLHPGRSGS